MHEKGPITIAITPWTIFTVFLFAGLFFLLFALRDIVLVVLTAVVIASAIEPAARFLMRFHLPRVVSVLLIYVGIIGGSFLIFYFLLPPLLQDASGFLATIPQYFDSFALSGALGEDALLRALDDKELTLIESLRELQSTLSTTSGGLFNTISAVFGGVLSFILIVVLSFYFTVQEQGIDDFLRMVSPMKYQSYILDLWSRSQKKIGRWMQGQLLLSLIVALLVFIGLSLMGVRYALLLAILAGVLELIPVFGSILAAVPAIAVSFIDGGTGLALAVVGFYVVVNQFQGNLIYPLVVQKVVGVPPLLVILALIVGGQLAGFLGIILSVPIAAILREFLVDMQREKEERERQEELPSPTT